MRPPKLLHRRSRSIRLFPLRIHSSADPVVHLERSVVDLHNSDPFEHLERSVVDRVLVLWDRSDILSKVKNVQNFLYRIFQALRTSEFFLSDIQYYFPRLEARKSKTVRLETSEIPRISISNDSPKTPLFSKVKGPRKSVGF